MHRANFQKRENTHEHGDGSTRTHPVSVFKMSAGQLSKLAELLAATALAETERAANATSREILAELCHLHSTCDKLLATAAEASAASKNALASTVAADKANCDRIVKTIADASSVARAAARTAALQWAYDHATVGEFSYASQALTDANSLNRNPYANYHTLYNTSKSGAFCAATILIFMKGMGKYLDGYLIEDAHQSKPTGERNTLASGAFRKAIIAQLHALIGVKPQEKLQDDGRYAIFLDAF